MPDEPVEDLLRRLAPQVLGAVVRRYGNFDTAEDAVQEAFLAAAVQWPADGVPDNPRGWLITVASRRLTDLLRSEQARRRREDTVAQWTLTGHWPAPAADAPASDKDDSLILLFLCCHPALPPASQIALTLRAVGGLTTAEIARAFLVTEATMTRRITRAKQRIAASGVPFRMPSGPERGERLGAVLHVLYLIFNEGYAATAGSALQRVELSAEAIRLTRLVKHLLPDDREVAGLLALMLLTDARRPARTGPDGAPVPMDEQDRRLWDAAAIAEGVSLVGDPLAGGAVGPYQLQAAISAVHDRAPDAEATDWPRIVTLYELLLQIADNPVVRLNHAVAVAKHRGAADGLALVEQLRTDERIATDHRFHAVRAHLLEELGHRAAAREAYVAAAASAASLPQQRYLNEQAARLAEDDERGPVSIDDIRELARDLPRSYEVVVRDRVKFRVASIVWLALSEDERQMGFAFPKEEREAMIAAEPDKFLLPRASDLRFNWLEARLDALDHDELREIVHEAWRMVVPKKVARAYLDDPAAE